MLLSMLSRKEKLKFLDLAIHMVAVDGEATIYEKRILNIMLAEVGDEIIKEYTFSLSSDLEETIDFFTQAPKPIRNVVLLNLFKISMFDDLYNATEHFFLDNIRRQFKISIAKRKELMSLIYEERDLKEKARRACLSA
ncbi:MAG: hypothetical protein PHF62_01390 [Acholeplasmataceae bacterium]|nr:hypothetical protein [Acholeplasmataceae bacterium]MDY0316400.1 hypothetical protein [Acholeplasmatales bacterium]